MGNFYVNHTIKGVHRDRVADILRAHRYSAYVSPEKNGCVVVAEAISDSHATETILSVARILSSEARAVVLPVGNADDDELFFGLYVDGEARCRYSNYVDMDDGTRATAVERICTALQVHQAMEAVTLVLNGRYVFAIERHAALVDALQLSDFAVGFGYRYVDRGDLPPSLQLIKTE
jgi:hypothetical protein